MKIHSLIPILLVLGMVVCLGWCVTLDLRWMEIQGQIAELADIAGEYRSMNAQLKEIRLSIQREADGDREILEGRMMDLEKRIEARLKAFEGNISEGQPAVEGKRSSSDSDKSKASLDKFKDVPKLDDRLLRQALDHLSPMLGLNREQEEKVRQVVARRVDDINRKIVDVQEGELDSKDAMKEIEEELESLCEELEPVLEASQMAVVKQLIGMLKDQAGQYL